MRRQAICGQPMRAWGAPGWSACGRRPGHPGVHISAESLARRTFRQAPSGSPAVAEAIRRAREDAGLSQRRLAVLVGVTDVCVGLWERAQRTPGAESWVQLELTLGPLGIVRDPKPEAAEGQQRGQAA